MKQNQEKIIFYVAEKSGGHLIPCSTLAQQEKSMDHTTKAILICGISALERAITSHANFDALYPMHIPSWSKTSWWQIPSLIYRIGKICCKTFFIIRKYKPIKVISTGGFITLPIALASYIQRIPLHLYELNATPGRTISLIAPLASKIFVCFAQAQQFFSKQSCMIASYPLRSLRASMPIEQARIHLGLEPGKPTIFIIGGSQGSVFLNQLWKNWLLAHKNIISSLQVIHHIGINDTSGWIEFYTSLNATSHIFTFSSDIDLCYRASSLVICRSGAGTLFELEACKVSYITIPLPTRVSSHQKDNAYAMQKQSSHATVACQEDLESNPTLFAQLMQEKFMPAIHQVFDQKNKHNYL